MVNSKEQKIPYNAQATESCVSGYINLSQRHASLTELSIHPTACTYMLLSGIQRKIRSYHSEEEINIFQQPVFKSLKDVCNAIFKNCMPKELEQK